MDYAGKAVLATGGTNGIGKAIICEFLTACTTVIIAILLIKMAKYYYCKLGFV
jgi:short-subunit dehydrogenase involved in D-alanine esterification of teichoic acids